MDAGMRRGNNRAAPGAMVDRKVLRSVRAVKARAVTGEARRRVGFSSGVCMLRYAMIQAASGGVERRKRSQGDGGGYDGSEKTGGETDEAIAVYTYGHLVRARNINSTRQGAPNLPGARTHFATPGQARETTICVGSALLRQCAPGFGRCFDGETHPSSTVRSEKHLKQTCPFHAPGGFPIDSG